MRHRDIALAVGVAAVWGFNFVMIQVGLESMPPLLFNTLRFGLAAFPALLFVGRPPVAWRWVLAVALTLAVAKFSLLFFGMDAGMPAGLSSVVLQSQAVFTAIFAVVLLGERPGGRQWTGLAVAGGGVGLVAWRLGPDRPALAFVLVVAAAVLWGVSNVALRRAAPANMLTFMVWVSATSTPILAGLSLLVEGPGSAVRAVQDIDATAVIALVYIAGVSTLAGWAAWGALIRRYGATTVAPFSMLVPFFGLASGVAFLGEDLHGTDLVGASLVVGGVLYGARPVGGRGTGGVRGVGTGKVDGRVEVEHDAPVRPRRRHTQRPGDAGGLIGEEEVERLRVEPWKAVRANG